MSIQDADVPHVPVRDDARDHRVFSRVILGGGIDVRRGGRIL